MPLGMGICVILTFMVMLRFVLLLLFCLCCPMRKKAVATGCSERGRLRVRCPVAALARSHLPIASSRASPSCPCVSPRRVCNLRAHGRLQRRLRVRRCPAMRPRLRCLPSCVLHQLKAPPYARRASRCVVRDRRSTRSLQSVATQPQRHADLERTPLHTRLGTRPLALGMARTHTPRRAIACCDSRRLPLHPLPSLLLRIATAAQWITRVQKDSRHRARSLPLPHLH